MFSEDKYLVILGELNSIDHNYTDRNLYELIHRIVIFIKLFQDYNFQAHVCLFKELKVNITFVTS